MNPELHLIGAFVTFFIRMSVASLLCLLISRLIRRPSQRFILWLAFTLGSAAFWVVALAGAFRPDIKIAAHLHIPGISFSPLEVSARGGQVLVSLAWIVGWIYISCLVVLCSCWIWKGFRLRRLLQLGSASSAEFSSALAALCQDLGVKSCELVVLPGIASPATVYWWRPRILLPEMCHQPGRLTEFVHIMRHELIHIRRRDYLVSAVVDVFCTVLFFHPAIWVARRFMRIERELACDLAVVEALPNNRADYAESLARFMRLSFTAKSESLNVYFAAPASLLSTRIRSILSEPAISPAWKRITSAGAGIAVALTFAVLASQFSLSFHVASGVRTQITASALPQISEARELTQPQKRRDCPKPVSESVSLGMVDAFDVLDCVLIPSK